MQNTVTFAAGGARRPALLVASFGTSRLESLELTIGAIESELRRTYPRCEVRRAFTSKIVAEVLRRRDGVETDSVSEALERLAAEGVREVVVQPTHIMGGYEYTDIVRDAAAYRDRFDRLRIGAPLLAGDSDIDRLISCLTAETAALAATDTALVYMGHGTEHEANAVYARLQQRLLDGGHENYFVGTVEAEPSLEDVLVRVKACGAARVVLLPLMIVAGEHASCDMAGDGEDSWKSVFAAAGFEVECVLRGLGQYAGVRRLIADHAAAAMAD